MRDTSDHGKLPQDERAKPQAGRSGALSVHRSFVVQLRSGADLAGRVEHVVTGEAREFRSAEELLAFFRRFLRKPKKGDDR